MIDFTALDFETAQGKRWSVCQVGIVRVENAIITNEISILVQPPDNYYWENFIAIHGITPEITAKALTFDKIWHRIEPFINDRNVVAHNGFAFDFPVLEQTLHFYHVPIPTFKKHCTYCLYKSNLANLCEKYAIPLQHHDALSDARACALLFLKSFEKNLI